MKQANLFDDPITEETPPPIQSDPNRDRKIPLIAKLLSLAGSDNEHEAKLAMEQASALMERYNISQAEAMAADPDKQTWNITTHRVHNIRLHLISLYFELAKFCDGKGVSHKKVEGQGFNKVRNRRDFSFYGTEEDFLNFMELCKYADLFMANMIRKEKKQTPNPEPGYRHAYKIGLCDGIEAAVNIIREEREARYRKLSDSTALILSGKAVAVADAYPRHLSSFHGSTAGNGLGLSRGQIHGKTFSPNGRVNKGATRLLR